MSDELEIFDDEPAHHVAAATADAKLPFKIIYYLFEDPTFFEMGVFGNGQGKSNKKGAPLKLASLCVIHTINVLIITSTVAVTMETIPQFSTSPHINPESYEDWGNTWNTLEVMCVVAFSLDLVIRCLGSMTAGSTELKHFWTD